MDYNIHHPAPVSHANPDLLLGAAAHQHVRYESRAPKRSLKMLKCDGVDRYEDRRDSIFTPED